MNEIEEKEENAEVRVGKFDFWQWSTEYAAWSLHSHSLLYIELDRLEMYKDEKTIDLILDGMYRQRYAFKMFVCQDYNQHLVRPLQYVGEGNIRVQERRERGGMRPDESH